MTKYCTESEKQNGCLGTERLRVFRLFPLVITWLMGAVAAAAQRHERGAHPGEKFQIQNTVSTESVTLYCTIKSNHCKSRNICTLQNSQCSP